MYIDELLYVLFKNKFWFVNIKKINCFEGNKNTPI